MDAIIAEGLGRVYRGSVWGIRDVSFRVGGGSLTVLLGPNGAGKTTTVKVLTTILKPTRGSAYVMGYDVVRDVWEVRRRVALCPQDVRVDPNWTPWEAVKGYLLTRGWGISDAEREAKVWLEELELWEVRNRISTHLSGGQRKRIAVAMVLATNADVMFLDEPTSGLDVEGRYKVWRALRTVIKNGGTILLTTHDMKEAELISDKVILISKGKVVAEGGGEALISTLPYRHTVIARGVRNNSLSTDPCRLVNLEDRLVIYAESKSKALSIASSIEAESVTISEVGLEDAYIYLTRGFR